jgi:hypothetical protein
MEAKVGGPRTRRRGTWKNKTVGFELVLGGQLPGEPLDPKKANAVLDKKLESKRREY